MRKDKAIDLWQAIMTYATACLKGSPKYSLGKSPKTQDANEEMELDQEIQRARDYLIDSFHLSTGWRPAREASNWRLSWGLTSRQPDRPSAILISPNDMRILLRHIDQVLAISEDAALIRAMERLQKQLRQPS